MTTNTNAALAEDLQDMVSKALRRAWQLGQTYWQQADSEYTSQHRNADETQGKFDALVEETRAALSTAAQPAVQQGEPLAWMDDGTLRAGSEATAYRVVTDATKRGMTASLAASFITPLYAHPAAPSAQGDALPREEFAWMVVQEACETEPADEDDPECIRILRRDLKSAVLAAFLREDAARMDKEGDQHG